MQTAQHENPQYEKSATGKECNMKKYNCTKLNNYELKRVQQEIDVTRKNATWKSAK